MFDDTNRSLAPVRVELARLLGTDGWAAARRSTLNAHYTDASIAAQVWATVSDLGFGGGRVLEPGCGTGVFLATAPTLLDLEAVGVEVEPVTARIARLLHPDADIRAEGFETTRLDRPVDLVVGNVPFAKVALHDPVHNPSRHSIHNHFLIKSLHLTRPGGLLAALTSRFTLDAQNPAGRREMAAIADFVGAVRLPSGAHRAAAGTDAVTDLLVFRRRHPDDPPAHAGPWERSEPLALDGDVRSVNSWFHDHPDLVVGTLSADNGAYGTGDLSVVAPPGPLGDALRAATRRLVEGASNRELRYQPAAPSLPRPAPESLGDGAANAKEGSVVRAGAGFARIVGGQPAAYEPRPRSDRVELAALCEVRDALVAVLDAQAHSRDDSLFAAAQHTLNIRYDAYLGRWGPLNRFKLARTGRRDPETGEDTYRRMYPRMGGFVDDPDYFSIRALEVFDPDTGTATKAAVFTRRVVAPRQVALGAERVEDALAICLDERGRVDVDRVANLLGTSAADARSELGERVFEDPVHGALATAEQYLSGDVRARLDAARAAAAVHDRFAVNVAALERVLPADLEPDEIDVRLGAPWIAASDIEQFCAELLDARDVEVEHVPLTATWAIAAPTFARRTVAATSEWGTGRADAVTLIDASLNQRPATVHDVADDGSRVINPAETFAAREKQDAIDARFGAWVWEEPTRARRLAAEYNRRFNSVVLPRYDGGHLSLPGLSDAFAPHAHQRDAVWRIVASGDTLLAHAVGAGKTATMVMAAMEQRRLGLIAKPAFVVPNHMLDQFARELLQLYPQARLLVASRDDASPAGRKSFVARCATGDWDAVVLTHTIFERIPVGADTRAAFLADRIEAFRAAINASQAGKGLTVKRLEAALARLESRHQELQAAETKDDGATFEHSGIDFVFVDEAHYFKNKAFPTRVAGVASSGSRRAEDLDVKLWWLRQRHGDRVACFATATPIANSVAELYVAQTYLQPKTVAAAGIDQFDGWAATFAATVAALELAPDGGSYRLTHRLARFRNVPELLTMARQVIDVRTADQLDLPVPALSGGRPETVVVEPADELRAYVASLVERAQAVRDRRVTPEVDNMLKITGDGRKAALDLRLVRQPPDPAGGKIAAAAERIAAIYQRTSDHAYLDADGRPGRRSGSLQLVFCDLGTPAPDRWNVYDHLKTLLVSRGVPADRIRFIHDAGNDRAKAELFAGCRDGRVNVLIGSTDKMGIGTNVQARAVALHHLDCPWRPADLEQREGRIIRQGNQNPAVAILRYVTEASFDIFMWQTVERKATFIAQVMHGNASAREIDDIGDQALSYAEVKALATGNPLIVEKAGVDTEVAKLTRLRTAHHRDQTALTRTDATSTARATRLQRHADACERAIDRRSDTRGDNFVMTLNGERHTQRADAGAQLRGLLPGASTHPTDIGTFAGFRLLVARNEHLGTATVSLGDTPVTVELDLSELASVDPGRLVQRIEHRLARLERDRDDAQAEARTARGEAQRAAGRLGQPFEHEPRLKTLISRQAALEDLLAPDPPAPLATADRLSAVATPAPGARSR